MAMHKYWADYSYDGTYEWPRGVIITREQTEEIDAYRNDIVTYISENYSSFITGAKPLSEWDAYVSELSTIGLDKVLAVYQEAYDTYLAK